MINLLTSPLSPLPSPRLLGIVVSFGELGIAPRMLQLSPGPCCWEDGWLEKEVDRHLQLEVLVGSVHMGHSHHVLNLHSGRSAHVFPAWHLFPNHVPSNSLIILPSHESQSGSL